MACKCSLFGALNGTTGLSNCEWCMVHFFSSYFAKHKVAHCKHTTRSMCIDILFFLPTISYEIDCCDSVSSCARVVDVHKACNFNRFYDRVHTTCVSQFSTRESKEIGIHIYIYLSNE